MSQSAEALNLCCCAFYIISVLNHCLKLSEAGNACVYIIYINLMAALVNSQNSTNNSIWKPISMMET